VGIYVTVDSLIAAFCAALHGLAIVVTLATVITATIPTRWRRPGLGRLFHLLNLLAGNVGHNHNANDR